MKQIQVQLFGAFSELDPSREIVVQTEGERVGDLRRALRALLARQWPQFKAGLLDYSAFADERQVLRDGDRLPEDGRVAILPPVSGG
ncbi:MAG: MoaD/ThiS family protein [Stenotrophomonas sp.]|jgi:molybdopterin synthase sulfur carrier subunit|uniref:MoaD/ThiS family protein n=1 Tax=unclassified Stenotrophomonas TaxID=196198 RepID=UPI00177B58A4|nr:MoaD/ThiS family protein [Stenotrophomonas sp. STM01]MBD9534252.1 MoaD/ThiS family protein [Stenotrophomonas sp. STM01]